MFESGSAQPKKKVRKWKWKRKLLDSDSFEGEETNFSGRIIKKGQIRESESIKENFWIWFNEGEVTKLSESESIKEKWKC